MSVLKVNTSKCLANAEAAEAIVTAIAEAIKSISSSVSSTKSTVDSAKSTHTSSEWVSTPTEKNPDAGYYKEHDHSGAQTSASSALGSMASSLSGFKYSKISDYATALRDVAKYVVDFDSKVAGYTIDTFLKGQEDGPKSAGGSLDGFFYSEVAEDGSTIMKYGEYDKDGNLVNSYKMSDLLNAVYTDVGMTMSAMISAALMKSDKGLSKEEQSEIYRNVGAYVTSVNKVQAFGVASNEDITAMKASGAAAGAVYGDVTNIWDELDSENELGGVLSGGAAVGLGMLGAYAMTDNFKANASAALKTTNSLEEEKTEEEEKKTTTPPGDGGRKEDNENDYYDDNEDSSKTVDTDDRIVKVTNTKLSKVDDISKIAVEDVDMLAKEEFFDRYSTGELLAERRLNDNQAFESLFSTEGKADLVEKFKEMGYSENEAIAAANNKDVGLAAFMLGSQNAETAQIAQDLAKEMGFGEDFDTVYDDKPDYADLFDGDAAASLMDPSTNTAVAEAKDAFNTAKDAYTESVTEANESIQAANEAKTELETIKAKIIGESGSDTSKWSDEQIKQYNEATRKYNTAVTKANEDVAESQAAKEAFNQAKVELKTKQEEYLEKIREAVREERGITGENSNSGNQAPNNEQTNSDPVIDSMSNEANKESTTDKIISDIVNNDQINNMIDGATNGGNNNNINKDNNVNTSGSTLDAINNIFSSM